MFQSDRRKDDSYRRAFGNGGLEVLETVIEPDAIYGGKRNNIFALREMYM